MKVKPLIGLVAFVVLGSGSFILSLLAISQYMVLLCGPLGDYMINGCHAMFGQEHWIENILIFILVFFPSFFGTLHLFVKYVYSRL